MIMRVVAIWQEYSGCRNKSEKKNSFKLLTYLDNNGRKSKEQTSIQRIQKHTSG